MLHAQVIIMTVFQVTHKFIFVSSAPPKIKTELQDSSCMTDQKMTFTVEVEGMPIPEVKWYVFNSLFICNFRHHCDHHHYNSPYITIQASFMVYKVISMDFMTLNKKTPSNLSQ
jgi:hypothetical protein